MARAAEAPGPVYHPRDPTASPLWKLLNDHYASFRSHYPAVFEKRYGFFRPVVDEVVEDYLACGDLREGFARVRCTGAGCGEEYLAAFSCHGRWFCPSCHQKRVLQFADQTVESILYPAPHRQYVFTIPRLLRVYFPHNRGLLTELCRCAATSLTQYLRELLGLPDGAPGIIVAIHTFGDYARAHAHLHAVVADGLFRPNGVFHVAPEADTKPLEELFRAQVLKMLRKAGKIDENRIRMLLGWRHSGFSTHRGNRIARDDREGQEALCQYILRNAFSVEKMTYVAETASVVYQSSMTHGASKKNFEIFTAEEFIAALTQHIPPKGYQMVRYFGWYSNRARGERKKRGLLRPGDEPEQGRTDDVTVLDVSAYDPPRLTSKTWRRLIHQVWEVDPLVCTRCGSEMKIIALIDDPAVIRRILTHLGLWRERKGNERGTAPPEEPAPGADLVYEPVDDGWPSYDESPYKYH